VELNETGRDPQPAPEQLRYARAVDAGMKSGLAILIAGFAVYAFEILPARVPLEDLSRVWTLSASDYMHAIGAPDRWGWLALLRHGDVLPLLGIAVLSAIPLVALLAAISCYITRRDWIYLVVASLQVGVLLLAASGALVTFH
jgi:hypothetical protein